MSQHEMSPNGPRPAAGVVLSESTWRVAELATLRSLVAPLERLAHLVIRWREDVTRARLLRLTSGTTPEQQREADDAATRGEHRVFTFLDTLLTQRRSLGASEPRGTRPVRTVVADPTVSDRRLLRYGMHPEQVIRDVALAMGAVSRDPTLTSRQQHDAINVLSWYQNDAELLRQGNTEIVIYAKDER
jgi:hypothetical protein